MKTSSCRGGGGRDRQQRWWFLVDFGHGREVMAAATDRDEIDAAAPVLCRRFWCGLYRGLRRRLIVEIGGGRV